MVSILIRTVVAGTLLAGMMVLFAISRGQPIGLPTVLGGLVAGALLGIIQAVMQHRRLAPTDRADGPLTREERKAAVVAVRKGQVPANERIRYAARALAQERANQSGRQGPRIILYLGLAAIFGVMAVLDNPWWVFGTLALLLITPLVVRGIQRTREAARTHLDRDAVPGSESVH
jgi:Flp pilus assembly protein TadB